MLTLAAHPPPDTPPWQGLFLAGRHAALGGWRPDYYRLERGGDGVYRARLPLDAGTRLSYLVTRGRWREVEHAPGGGELAPRQVTATGGDQLEAFSVAGFGRASVDYVPGFASQFLPHARTLTVYKPPGYDADPGRRYGVLYLGDGQNLFDDGTAFGGTAWRCDDEAERVIRAGEAQPLLIVGVANSPDRMQEYGPRRCGRGREADLSRAYGRFLVEEVKPFIDQTYRTLPGPRHTGVGGSSLGGLIALHLCKWFPNAFGLCAAISPSVWWDREYFLRTLPVAPQWLAGCRVWLDMGGQEGYSSVSQSANLRRGRRLAKLLGERGATGLEFRYLEVPDGRHNESDWGRRFGEVVKYLYPPDSDGPAGQGQREHPEYDRGEG